MPKRFTLAEAQGLIPKVGRLLREAIGRKAEYDDAERAIQSFHERVMVMGGEVEINRTDAVKPSYASLAGSYGVCVCVCMCVCVCVCCV